MKIIHVFSVFGTAESFFDGQFKYLASQGYEIIVVSSNSAKACKFCKQNSVRFIPIYIPRSISPIAITKAIANLCSLIRKEKPDAVFGHTPVGALCAMTAATLCRVKNRIYYRHGVIYTTMPGIKHFIFKIEERLVASLASNIINVSNSLSRLAEKDKLNNAKKQFVIGHGTCGGIDAQNVFNPSLIDKTRLYTLKEKFKLSDENIIFGFCGRICNDKGISELIDAFELFQTRHHDTKPKLLLIGHFDIRDGISDYKKQQIEANNNIIITGYVEKSDIPYFYSILDVFVFPSHREGFGMCVIEASAMERPILDSRAHGCIDAIVEHETGEYIDLTAEGICKGMEMMLNQELRERLGKNGRKKVLEWYDVKRMWPIVADLYKNILK